MIRPISACSNYTNHFNSIISYPGLNNILADYEKTRNLVNSFNVDFSFPSFPDEFTLFFPR